MCDYCMENAVVFGLMRFGVAASDTSLADAGSCYHLQESADLAKTLAQIRDFDDCDSSIEAAFCRLFEEGVESGNLANYGLIEEIYGRPAIDAFISRADEALVPFGWSARCLWQRLAACLVNDDHDVRWADLMRDSLFLNTQTMAVLAYYCDHWLYGDDRLGALEDIGQMSAGMDAGDINLSGDHSDAQTVFPLVFFSLAYLAGSRSSFGSIRRIALREPRDSDGFLGYGLWLQRRAFLACIERYGLGFIFDHASDLRFSLVYYLLLKKPLEACELKRLKTFLQLDAFHDDYISDELVLELIKSRLQNPASSHEHDLDNL